MNMIGNRLHSVWKILYLRRLLLCLLFEIVDAADCSDRLVTGPSGVPDDHISATSAYSFYPAKAARLYSDKCWAAFYENWSDYIQVDFDSRKTVLAVQTQGCRHSRTTSYLVSYKSEWDEWKRIEDSENKEKVFRGNDDSDTVVTNILPEPIIAKSLRIHPRTKVDYMALRFEVIGCKPDFVRNDWTLHPITITALHNSLWNRSAPALGICAMICNGDSSCQSFIFHDDYNNCLGFGQEYFYGLRMVKIQGNKYFRRFASLNLQVKGMKQHGYSHEQNIFYKIHSKKMNASLAKSVCKSESTELFFVGNIMLMDILRNAIRMSTTITDQNYLLYVSGSRFNGTWMYSNKDIPNNVWAAEHPKDDVSLCVVLSYKGLKTEECSPDRNFICGF